MASMSALCLTNATLLPLLNTSVVIWADPPSLLRESTLTTGIS